MTHDDLVKYFSMFDLNSDSKITLKEFIKADRSAYDPMTAHLQYAKPWMQVANKIFFYMDEYLPTGATDLTPRFDKKVSKSDFKATVPVFWPEHTGDDAFVDR